MLILKLTILITWRRLPHRTHPIHLYLVHEFELRLEDFLIIFTLLLHIGTLFKLTLYIRSQIAAISLGFGNNSQ